MPVERGQRDADGDAEGAADEAEEQAEGGGEAGGAGAGGEGEGEALWVQCDDCGKWRRLPMGCEAPDEDAAWSWQVPKESNQGSVQ